VVHFTDYIRCAPTWHTKWKLVNRNVRNGFVTLDASECARLIQETVFAKIADELFSLAPPPDVLRLFRDNIMDLKKRLAAREKRTNIGEVKEENYPPCISRLVAAARSGVNIPHVGRFTLVTFLNSIGMKTDDILAVFAGSPDFNKEKTRYQVEHITGRASSTTYKTPRCDTILTWGLCVPDDLCKTVRHPLAYYVRRGRK
jgi:DNA primase large subunit